MVPEATTSAAFKYTEDRTRRTGATKGDSMNETLERVDIFSTAFLVIDVNDYLEVRRSDWADVERAGAVVARDGKVYISPDLAEILSTVSSKFPSKYAADGRRK